MNTLFDLTGRVALVTGAGFGLGRAFADGLAAAGAQVIVADRDRPGAQETADAICARGGAAQALSVDVADPVAVEAMAADALGIAGRVDILVNNAGVASGPFRTHALEIADWQRVIAVDLTGVFLCSRALIPAMLAAGSGSIINVSSIVGLVGYYPGFARIGAAYAAAKAGVIGLTRQMAVEYAAEGIRCNAIAPGWHGGTRLGAAAKAQSSAADSEAFEQSILDGTPMRRRGRPEELAGLVVYLAAEASSYVTGQVFTQDGGWTAA